MEGKADRVFLLFIIIAFLLIGGLLVQYGHLYADDAFIYFRVAKNVHLGRGACINEGEPRFAVTSPLYFGIIVLLGFFTGDYPLISYTFGILCLLCFAVLNFRFFYEKVRIPLLALAGVVILCAEPLFLGFLRMETVLYLTFCSAALLMAARRRYAQATLWALLATITRLDGILLLGLVLAAAFIHSKRIPWKYVLLSAGGLIVFLVLCRLLLGGALPDTLEVKRIQGDLGIYGRNFGEKLFLKGLPTKEWYFKTWYLVFLPPFLVGCYAALKERDIFVLIFLWTGLYSIAYALLRVPYIYLWYFAPVAYGVLALSVRGLLYFTPKKSGTTEKPWLYRIACSWTLVAVLYALFAAAAFPYQPSVRGFQAFMSANRDVAQWLTQNTPPQATIFAEAIGVLGYHADRRLIDPAGIATPGVTQALKRRDFGWVIRTRTPDYAVVREIPFPLEKPFLEIPFSQQYEFVRGFEAPGFAYYSIKLLKRIHTDSGKPSLQHELQDPGDLQQEAL